MIVRRAPRDWDGGRWVGCYLGRAQIITRVFRPEELRTPKVVSGWFRAVNEAISSRDGATLRRLSEEAWGQGQALDSVARAIAAGLVVTVRAQ